MSKSIILSHSITVGQITFIVRVAVQLLSYGGLALIGILILANAPRLASISTHDVVSRTSSASTTTFSNIKWLFSRLRQRSPDPFPLTNLFLILALAVSYATFVALSDIGLLGLDTCDVSGENVYETPASVNNTNDALGLLSRNLINGTDYSAVRAFRCDASELIFEGVQNQIPLDRCTTWRNGTYGDQSFFVGLNSTDSDVLMPRQLNIRHIDPNATSYLSSYLQRFGTKLDSDVMIVNGMAIDPHEGGMTAIIGVPNLRPNYKAILEKVIALEVDIGCMSIGIDVDRSSELFPISRDAFSTKGDWRKYTGPEYMRDILSSVVDNARAYWKPLFATFPANEDGVIRSNSTSTILSPAAFINNWYFDQAPNSTAPSSSMFQIELEQNCSVALHQTLGSTIRPTETMGTSCAFVGVGGSVVVRNNGTITQAFNRMVCAAATQVNMVRATVEMDPLSRITMDITRLPSDLNYVHADYWDVTPSQNKTLPTYNIYDPYLRYTLSENPNGETQHFILSQDHKQDYFVQGIASGGNVIARIGHAIMGWPKQITDLGGLLVLPEGFEPLDLTRGTNIVSRWTAQLAASFLVNSVGYNGWAAKNADPILMVSTGGHIGTCYKTAYAFGFLPLLLAAAIIAIWCIVLLISRSITGTNTVKEAYGGLGTYTGAVCPGAPNETLLVWQTGARPKLEVVSKEVPVLGDGSTTALKHLKSDESYPQL